MSPLKNALSTLSSAIIYKTLKMGVMAQTSNTININIPHQKLIFNVIDSCSALLFSNYAQPFLKPNINYIYDEVSLVMVNDILPLISGVSRQTADFTTNTAFDLGTQYVIPALSTTVALATDLTYYTADTTYDFGINYAIPSISSTSKHISDLTYAASTAFDIAANIAKYSVSKANDLIIYCKEFADEGLHKLENDYVLPAIDLVINYQDEATKLPNHYNDAITYGLYNLTSHYVKPVISKAYDLAVEITSTTLDGLHNLNVSYIVPTIDYVNWWWNQPSDIQYKKILVSSEIVVKGTLTGLLKTSICSYQDMMPLYIQPICSLPIVSVISGFTSNFIFSSIVDDHLSEYNSIISGLDSKINSDMEIGLIGISYV